MQVNSNCSVPENNEKLSPKELLGFVARQPQLARRFFLGGERRGRHVLIFKVGVLVIILGLNREKMPSYVLKSPPQSSSGPSPGFKPGLTPGDGVRRAPGRDLSVLMELQLSLEHHLLNV